MKDKNKDDYFQEKSSFLGALCGLISFSTILSIRTHTTIKSMAKIAWTWPFISGFIGVLGFFITCLLVESLKFPSLITVAILYGFFLYINGFHHLDGLLDFGDAIMVHGSPKKKIAIMRDPNIGTGGIGLFFIVAIITLATLDSIINFKLFPAIIIIEMSTKISLLTVTITSKPSNDGTGKFFIEYLTTLKYLIAIVLCITISYLLLSYVGVFGVIGGVIGGVIVSVVSERNFKIATGDVLGASNEIGRLFSGLFILIAFILFIYV
ncbi:MAG: adenosylcobinamide-GDP ribazoletransferase [Methanobrevibacter sp.]|jgi:adenosylcobinamide-GDP ribazoletransferase|nr:adenosylcobinamide-GDP ribazoletransferase [Candidatus Methanovirga basalitermitum]